MRVKSSKENSLKKQKSEACLGSYAMSKMEFFVTFINGFQLLTNVTNKSILDYTGVLDPPLIDITSFIINTVRVVKILHHPLP